MGGAAPVLLASCFQLAPLFPSGYKYPPGVPELEICRVLGVVSFPFCSLGYCSVVLVLLPHCIFHFVLDLVLGEGVIHEWNVRVLIIKGDNL